MLLSMDNPQLLPIRGDRTETITFTLLGDCDLTDYDVSLVLADERGERLTLTRDRTPEGSQLSAIGGAIVFRFAKGDLDAVLAGCPKWEGRWTARGSNGDPTRNLSGEGPCVIGGESF
jgi:hypothetical protein